MKKYLVLAVFMVASFAYGQTWFKVAAENQSVTVPAGTTVRYGFGTLFDPNKTFATATTFTASNTYFGTDPDVGIVKELDVLETSVVQKVTVAGVSVTVPALPVVGPQPGTLAYCSTGLGTTPTLTYTLTFNASGKITAGNATLTCN